MAVDNTKTAQELNALIAERQKMLESQNEFLKTQTQLWTQMMQTISSGKGRRALDDLTDKIGKGKDATAELARIMRAAQKDVETGNASLEKSFGHITALVGGMTKQIVETFKKKAPTAFVVGTAAVSGFAQGLENVFAMAKGLGGVLGGVLDGVFNIGKAILAIPFKILDSLIEKASSGGGGTELMQAYENVRKEFGSFKEDASKNVIAAAQSMRGELSKTGLSTFRVFGNLAQKLEYVTELAVKMGPTFNVLGKQVAQSAEEVGAFQKGLGLSAEEMGNLGQRTIATGKPLTASLLEISNYSLQMGKDFGVSQKLIGKDIGKMNADVSHFGNLGVKEMSQLSVYTRKLGIEFTKVLGVVDKFDTFEDAAENAAHLSQAFGVNINAFEEMKEQDPGKRLDDLRKAMMAAGRSAETMSRQELKLLAQTTGLDEETAKLAFSSKNQGVSYDELKKKSDKAQKSQLTQTQAMSKLADSIERLVMSGGQLKGFFDTFMMGIERGLTSLPEFRMIMINIRQALMVTLQAGVKLGQYIGQHFPGIMDAFKGLRDLFEPKKFRTLLDGVVQSFERFIDDLGGPNGKASFPALMQRLRKHFFEFFDRESGPGKKIVDGARKFFKALFTIAGEGVKWMSEQLRDGIRALADIISGKQPIEGLGQAQAGAGLLRTMLQPLLEGLSDAVGILKPALGDLFEALVGEAKKWVSGHKGLLAEIGGMIIGYLFVSSLVNAATAAFSMVIIKAATGLLSSTVSKVLKKTGTKLVEGMLEDDGSATKAISKSVTEAFGKATSSGADVGSSVGGSAAKTMMGKMGGVAESFAQKLGYTGAGSALGLAAGAAVAAYIAVEGKKLIDETFEKGHKADVNLRGGEMEAWQALSSRTPMEKKLEQIKKLQDTIEDQQKELNEKGFGQKALNWIAGTDIAADQAADALAKSKSTLMQLQEQVKKASVTGTNAIDVMRKKAAEGAATNKEFFGASSVSDAKDKLEMLDVLAKKVKGKDFDIQKTLSDVKAKFEGVSFEILSADKSQQLEQSMGSLKSVGELAQGIKGTLVDFSDVEKTLSTLPGSKRTDAETVDSISKRVASVSRIFESLPDQLAPLIASSKKVAETVKTDGVAVAVSTVKDMVAAANQLNTALADGNINRLDVPIKLEKVARAVGLGGKGQFTVKNKDVNITLNLEVKMEAGAVEEVIVRRSNSKIRGAIEKTLTNKELTVDNLLGTKLPGA